MALPVPVDDPQDPRVADFVGLRERTAEDEGAWFVAEGPQVVRHLLSSDYRLRSLLVTERGRRALAGEIERLEGRVLVAEQSVLDAICGFHFHRGALASADRTPLPDFRSLVPGARLLLLLEGVNDHENLGALFRNAAGFGVDGVILDPTAADPLYRRSVRVSMGHVLHMPWTRFAAWPEGLDEVRSAGFVIAALTPAPGSEPIDAVAADPPEKLAFLVGAEGPGLSDAALAAADRRIRIPLSPRVDSLNVATAAAIAFHRLAPGFL